MNLKIITAPVTEPVSLTEAKSHLRITHTNDDTLIISLIKVARQQAESITLRSLASAVYDLSIDDFPTEEIVLPMPPVESITSIKYKDSDGVEATWDSDEWIFYNSEPAVILPAYGEAYPTFTPYPIGAVTIRFTAGYKTSGDDADLIIPEELKQAIKLLVANYYEYREDLLTRGHIPKTVPFGVNALLSPYRLFTF
jgi:uncharacterized phiE125 gp8 family phage protein